MYLVESLKTLFRRIAAFLVPFYVILARVMCPFTLCRSGSRLIISQSCVPELWTLCPKALIEYRQSNYGTIQNDICTIKGRKLLNVIDAQCHFCQSDDWIFCVSLATRTCNVWRYVLSHICRSIGRHLERYQNVIYYFSFQVATPLCCKPCCYTSQWGNSATLISRAARCWLEQIDKPQTRV